MKKLYMILTKRKLVYCLLSVFLWSIPAWGHTYSKSHILMSISQSRQITVHGTVTDASSGNPLPGVTVSVKGTVIGTTTDAEGRFTLGDLPDKAVLVISFIGYETREVNVGDQLAIQIQLHPSNTSLNEVVVVGYGTEKKMDLTGAVDQVSGKILANRPMPNVMRGLEGTLPGVYINMPSGSPTQSYTPVIRGAGSIGAGGSALILIDGVPGDLSTLNPDDIQSIS
ncbi:MAG: carboxypeptidase-like regulatory domain-containing protein, partial [Chitinophagaceae bacterium]